MKQIFYIPVICSCLCFCGCSLYQETGFLFESYVTEYNNIDYDEEPKLYNTSDHKIAVVLPTETYAYYAWDGISERWKQDNPDWELWHARHCELSQKNGDVAFNQIVNLEVWDHSVSVWNTDNLISAITIISNADYDSKHPAGASLNDAVEIVYRTHKPFIENGYKHKIIVDGVEQVDKDRPTNDYSGDVVSCKLSEMQLPADAILMSSDGFNLHFINQPASAKSHTFTVTIEFEYGEPYSFTLLLN